MNVNPFSTRYVRPGAIPWIEVSGNSVTSLADRFFGECHRRAAIIGPHGTGKSTLLEHLVPVLGRVVYKSNSRESQPVDEDVFLANSLAHRQAGIAGEQPGRNSPVVWLALRRNDKPLRRLLATYDRWTSSSILVIDGFEQLTLLGRWMIQWLTRFHQLGLLVTAHHRYSLPVLLETQPAVEVLDAVIRHAWKNAGLSEVHDVAQLCDLQRMLDIESGNTREVLMRMYDEYARASANSRAKAASPGDD